MTDYGDYLINLRQELHKIPEPGKGEFKTQALIIKELEKMGIGYYKIGTGTVAEICGKSGGRCVGYRADIDALPITEKNNVPYKSRNEGFMHACGHDAHTAIALGVCRFFGENRDFSGCLKVFFQPDEEGDGGALPMIKAGCLENPRVDYCLALHVSSGIETGKISVKKGVVNGASNTFNVKIFGKSAHGASPECGIDAVVIASHIVIALQSVVSRSVSPHDNAVLTIGQISGGTAGNIICGEVDIKINIRTISESTKEIIIKKIYNICRGISESMGGGCEIEHIKGYEILRNDDETADIIISRAIKTLGAENVLYGDKIDLGVEDFCYFSKYTKGGFFHLGCGNKSLGIDSPGHSDTFDIDMNCLNIGAGLSVGILKDLLNKES